MEHRTLHQVLRAASTNPLNARSFIKLAVGCSFLTTVSDSTDASTPTSHISEPSSSASLFPSAKAISGLAALIASGHFCVCPATHSSTYPEEAIRCDLVEPLGAIILLFPECFLEQITSPTGGDLADNAEFVDEFLGAHSQSLDTSLDSVAQPPSGVVLTPSSQFGHRGYSTHHTYTTEAFDEMRAQRDALAMAFISDIDEQVKRGSARLLTLQHVKAAQAVPSKKYTAPSRATGSSATPVQPPDDIATSSHLGEAVMVGVQHRLARLHLWKLLLVSSLASTALSAPNELHQSGNFTSPPIKRHDVLDRIIGGEWTRVPMRVWGWPSLAAAERQYDAVVQSLNTLVQPHLVTSSRLMPTDPFQISVHGSQQTIAFPFPSSMGLTLAQATTSLSQMRRIEPTSTAMLFNDSDSTFSTLLDVATQRKLAAAQLSHVGALITECFQPPVALQKRRFHIVARQRITLTFLSRGEKYLSLLAERNREVFILLFRTLSTLITCTSESGVHDEMVQCRSNMTATLVSMGVSEPSCHVAKVLHDEKLIDDSDFTSFVSRAVELVGAAQVATNSPSQEAQQRIQRSVTLLSLLLQNMFLANKRVVLIEPVDQVLIAFCLEHSKVRACSDLYRTLMTLRGKHS